MKKYTLFLFVFLASLQLSLAQVTWEADPMHSNIHFSINHLGISFIDGQFDKMEGAVTSKSETDFDDAVFNFTVETASINTRVDQRDEHLQSADFFDAKKYPQITLQNGKLEKSKKGKYTLTGDLTMKDVTKKVTFDVDFHGVITDPWDNKRAGLTATTKINRKDFNINYNNKLPSGVDEVGNEVKIVVNTEMVKKTK